MEEEARAHRHHTHKQAVESDFEKSKIEEEHCKILKDLETDHAQEITLRNKKETKAKNMIASMRRERQGLMNQASAYENELHRYQYPFL